MAALFWQPPNSQAGLGLVRFGARPLDRISPAEYRLRLAVRIDEMVAREVPERALNLFEKTAWEAERLIVKTPDQIGDVLAENSQWLRERGGTPTGPISPASLFPSPELEASWKDASLEDFLGLLYQPPQE